MANVTKDNKYTAHTENQSLGGYASKVGEALET